MPNEIEIQDHPSQPAAVIHLTIPRTRMQEAFPRAIHEILDTLESQGMAPAGPAYARHFRFDPETFDFEVGFPIAGSVEPDGRVQSGELPAARVVRTVHRGAYDGLPAARVVRTVHRGAYDGLPAAWDAFRNEVESRDLPVGKEFRERYVAGPEVGPDPSQWRTELSWVLSPA